MSTNRRNLIDFGRPHGEIKLESMETDRFGIISAVITQRRNEDIMVSRENSDLRKIAPNWLVPLNHARRAYKDGHAIYTFSYLGVTQEWTFDERTQTVYEFDVAMNQSPIGSHPNFQHLSRKYGWDNQRKEFPEFIETAPPQDGIDQEEVKQEKNPFYGVTDYLEVGGVLRVSKASRNLPGDVYRDIGTIIDRPADLNRVVTGSFNIGNRNWLKLGPKVKRRGNVFEWSEEYLLSGPRGWEPEIYSRQAYAGRGGSR
jgi:hypothetical protein